MNCKTAQQMLSSYIDSELTGSEMMRLRKHLNECDGCAREETELRSLKGILGGVPVVEPPSGFEDRLCSKVFAAQRSETEKWTSSWPFLSGIALITAALTLLVVNHLSAPSAGSTDKPAGVVARELQRDQTAFAGANPIFDSTPAIPANYDGR